MERMFDCYLVIYAGLIAIFGLASLYKQHVLAIDR
jgi:hypothetical protein